MSNVGVENRDLDTHAIGVDVSLAILAYIGIQCKSIFDNLKYDSSAFIYDKPEIAAAVTVGSSALMMLYSSYLYNSSPVNHSVESTLDDGDADSLDLSFSSINPISSAAVEASTYQNPDSDDLAKPILDPAADLDNMITYTDIYERTHLHNACIKGDYELVAYLINKGADVNKEDDEGITPLQYASMQEQVHLIELLIQNGADVNHGDEKGYTALHYACWNGYISVARYLVEFGADVNLKDVDGNTPLNNAIAANHEDVVKYLEKQGAELTTSSNDVENLISDNVLNTTEVNPDNKIELLPINFLNGPRSRFGIDPDMHVQDGYTALHRACRNGNLKDVELLVTQGCDINLQDEDGCSPLHYAALHGNVDVVRHLINKGGNINILDQDSRSPLHYAALHGHVDVAKLLIQKGADVTLKDITGKTALRYAFDCPDLVLCFYNTKAENVVSEEELKEFLDCNDIPAEKLSSVNVFSEYTKDLINSLSGCYSVISDEVANFYHGVISSPANCNFAAGLMAGILGGMCLSLLASQSSVASILQPTLIPEINIIGSASLLSDAIYYELPKALVEMGM